jgi:hypothetical protein
MQGEYPQTQIQSNGNIWTANTGVLVGQSKEYQFQSGTKKCLDSSWYDRDCDWSQNDRKFRIQRTDKVGNVTY